MANLSFLNALIKCSIDCPSMCNWPVNVQCPQCLPHCMLYEIGFGLIKWGVVIKKHVFSLSNKCFWILWILWCNYWSMHGLRLIHVSKRVPKSAEFDVNHCLPKNSNRHCDNWKKYSWCFIYQGLLIKKVISIYISRCWLTSLSNNTHAWSYTFSWNAPEICPQTVVAGCGELFQIGLNPSSNNSGTIYQTLTVSFSPIGRTLG